MVAEPANLWSGNEHTVFGLDIQQPGSLPQAERQQAMSDLPNTNDAVASEWVRRAKLVYDRGPRALGAGDSKLAVKDYATAAELALNAVYIKHGKHYLRTHNIGDLVQQCPDPTVRDAVEGYPGQFIRLFSQNCLAPYVRAHPVPEEEVEQCREFSRRIVGWAAGAVNP